MIKNMYFIGIVFVMIMSNGCAQKTIKPPLYLWDNYQYTSSAYGMYGEKKEILDRHTQEVKKIIEQSESKNQRVAPGIYAEYGQLLYENNKKEEAKQYLLLEKSTYPESAHFIDLIIMRLYGEKS